MYSDYFSRLLATIIVGAFAIGVLITLIIIYAIPAIWELVKPTLHYLTE